MWRVVYVLSVEGSDPLKKRYQKIDCASNLCHPSPVPFIKGEHKSMKKAIIALVCFLFGTISPHASILFMDNASSDNSSDYTMSATQTSGSLTHNAASGAYEIRSSGQNANVGWYYDAASFSSSGGVLKYTVWWNGLDGGSGDNRNYLYMTWNNTEYADPGDSYAYGYAVRTKARESYASNDIMLYQKKEGNAGSGLYRNPAVGSLVEELDSVELGDYFDTDPIEYYRTEFTIADVGGLNSVSVAMYQGATPEFADSDNLLGQLSFDVSSNITTDGYIGFGMRHETPTSSDPFLSVNKIQVDFTQTVPEPSGLLALGAGLILFLHKRLR